MLFNNLSSPVAPRVNELKVFGPRRSRGATFLSACFTEIEVGQRRRSGARAREQARSPATVGATTGFAAVTLAWGRRRGRWGGAVARRGHVLVGHRRLLQGNERIHDHRLDPAVSDRARARRDPDVAAAHPVARGRGDRRPRRRDRAGLGRRDAAGSGASLRRPHVLGGDPASGVPTGSRSSRWSRCSPQSSGLAARC